MEKIFHAKLDPDIESLSHETHFDTFPSTSIFRGRTRKFLPSISVRKPLLEFDSLYSFNGQPSKIITIVRM